jgi:hypothetical protein
MGKLEEIDAERLRLERVEQALSIQQKKISRLLKELYEGTGRGPYMFSQGSFVICTKGDTYYLMPCKGTKGP